MDLTRPSVARVYDHYLGGSHNFAVDREFGRRAVQMWPELPAIMRANRAFLRRSVRFAAESGVRQFLDIGSGIPTVGSVHEVARETAPDARVVYVDSDPVAVAHSQAILAGDPLTAVLRADLREPSAILGDPIVTGLLDLNQPVAVLLVAILHFVTDADDPWGAVAALRDATAPGSLLVISHATAEAIPEEGSTHEDLYARADTPMTMRPSERIAPFFEGFEIVRPGIVPIPMWRPDPGEDPGDARRYAGLAGVGRHP